MRFRASPDALADAVAWVARELPARPVVPVLSGLRLQAGQDGLALSCFDYDIAATAHIDAEVSEPGTALVPGRLLADITRSLPSQPADVATSDDEVTLTCGSAEFTLVALPLAEYPAPPEPPPPSAAVDGGEFAAAVGQVLPAASRDDTLPVLTAVSLDIDGDVLTLAATDRYRLAVRRLHWHAGEQGLRAIALVPARTLADAARMMTPGVPVSVALPPPSALTSGGRAGPRPSEGLVSFSAGGRRLAGRLLAGEFLRYESRFPTDFTCRAEVSAASFTEAVRRVALVADRASPVRLTFGDGRVLVEAQTEGRARAAEAVTASFHGDTPSIAFNPHYLLDGLSAAVTGGHHGRTDGPATGGEEAGMPDTAAPVTVRLEFTSPAKPALVTLAEPGDDGAPAFRYLVVPLRPQQAG